MALGIATGRKAVERVPRGDDNKGVSGIGGAGLGSVRLEGFLKLWIPNCAVNLMRRK